MLHVHVCKRRVYQGYAKYNVFEELVMEANIVKTSKKTVRYFHYQAIKTERKEQTEF